MDEDGTNSRGLETRASGRNPVPSRVLHAAATLFGDLASSPAPAPASPARPQSQLCDEARTGESARTRLGVQAFHDARSSRRIGTSSPSLRRPPSRDSPDCRVRRREWTAEGSPRMRPALRRSRLPRPFDAGQGLFQRGPCREAPVQIRHDDPVCGRRSPGFDRDRVAHEHES
jgi:hypothetical protein